MVVSNHILLLIYYVYVVIQGSVQLKTGTKVFSSQWEYVTSNIFSPILEIRIGGCIYVNFTWFYWSINIIWFYFDDIPPPLLL